MSESDRIAQAFQAARARRTVSSEAMEKLDAAMEEVADWRATCHICHANIIGSKAMLQAHAEACKRDH